MEKTREVEGVSGLISLNRKHDAEGSVVVMQIKEDKIVFRERISPGGDK